MIPSFQLQFYKGDTPTLVVDLIDCKGTVDIQQAQIKLYVQDFQIDAVVNEENQAGFFVSKNISQQLRPGMHKAWVQCTTNKTKYSFYGYFKVRKARL